MFLSDGGSKQILERDGRLTFSRLDVGGSSAAKRTFVARRQSQGQSVVYFGDCERERALANLADVAVTVKEFGQSTDLWYTHRFSVPGFREVWRASRPMPKVEHRSH